MSSFELNSGRQFEVDPITGQMFYRELIDRSYSPWTPAEPLENHRLSQPATCNVSLLFVSPICSSLIFL